MKHKKVQSCSVKLTKSKFTHKVGELFISGNLVAIFNETILQSSISTNMCSSSDIQTFILNLLPKPRCISQETTREKDSFLVATSLALNTYFSSLTVEAGIETVKMADAFMFFDFTVVVAVAYFKQSVERQANFGKSQ